MQTNPPSKVRIRSRNDTIWAADLSGRLRAIQASFADDPPEERQHYLAEEIERALQGLLESERLSRLELLAELFPVWDMPAGPVSAPPSSGADTPEDLIRRLVTLAPRLSNSDRAALAVQLASAGFEIPAASESSPPAPRPAAEVPPELQKRLGVEPNQELDLDRVLRLVAILVEFAVTLDHLGWSVWKNIAPNSIIRREPGATGEFRKLAGPYLTGDSEVSTTQVSQAIDKARRLIAGLIAAIGATGETFARQFLTRFSPTEIKAAAEVESGFFLGPEQKCWRRYVALFHETSGVAIEQEISQIVASYTENLITGANRPKAASAVSSHSPDT
jgi:hypothetical protein